MKFEHLIEINNPADPRIEPLTREQLWLGLVLRTEEPALFIPHLDSCTIVARSTNTVSRRLKFGDLTVNDHAHYLPLSRIHIQIPEQPDILASTLEITIEEPQPERLFVRFAYEDTAPEEGPEAFYHDFRRKAWKEADIDTIRLIREMAAQGRFGG
ncbi:MAG: SRPBCC family protein [Alistipes senegalensis]|nr:SRPBCC family protein [Oxalobacter formigenes]MCM1280627.1 SRPBCC family protein [Alistipes senegalensis]